MDKTVQYYYRLIGLESDDQRIVQGITNDSRDCEENWIYISTQENDLKQQYCLHASSKKAIVFDFLEEPMQILSDWINDYYNNPSQHFFVIGITGTNGKTSVSSYLKQSLERCGKRCIRLGSDENEFKDKKIRSKNTTMNIMDNLKVFLSAKEIDIIIMEVSSHAIVEQRMGFIHFDRIIYTNISPEHLDYHKTFSNYVASKFRLRFNLKTEGIVLINAQRRELLPLKYLVKNIIQYGENLHEDEVKCSMNGSLFEYAGQSFTTMLLGFHHVMNLMAVITCLNSMGISFEQIQSVIPSIQGYFGRMEKVIIEGRVFIVDYAHTASSLEALCQWARSVSNQRVFCVMGCGGERDREKRPLMVQVAFDNCDQVIICEDNSRNEPFQQILVDMQLHRFAGIMVIEKRQQAIQEAFRIAKKDDIILVAGKGNEQFLVAKDKKTPYNDKAFIQQLTS